VRRFFEWGVFAAAAATLGCEDALIAGVALHAPSDFAASGVIARVPCRILVRAPGTAPLLTERDFDARGRLLFEATDRGADGVIDASVRYSYNDALRLVMRKTDANGDGEPDSGFVRAFDAQRNLLRNEVDTNGDGVAEWVEVRTFDDRGNVLSHVTDIGNDGVAEAVHIRTYDEANHELTHVGEDFRTGRATRSASVYDARGLRVESATDFGADGSVDWSEKYTYDARGNLVRAFRARVERDFEPEEDRFGFVYDEAGRVVLQFDDRHPVGFTENFTAFAYDAQGRISIMTYYLGGHDESQWDRQTIYTYGSETNVVEEFYAEGDGVPRGTTITTRDLQRRLLSIETRYFGGGPNPDVEPNEITTYTYDAHGRLVEVARDVGLDGEIEGLTVNTYECDAAP